MGVEEAIGYLELGMLSEAWEIIEDLPPEEKTNEPVLVIRLRILTGLSQWELGEHIASVLLSGGDESRQAVARFHHARARALWQSGDYDGARDQFRLAVDAWWSSHPNWPTGNVSLVGFVLGLKYRSTSDVMSSCGRREGVARPEAAA